MFLFRYGCHWRIRRERRSTKSDSFFFVDSCAFSWQFRFELGICISFVGTLSFTLTFLFPPPLTAAGGAFVEKAHSQSSEAGFFRSSISFGPTLRRMNRLVVVS